MRLWIFILLFGSVAHATDTYNFYFPSKPNDKNAPPTRVEVNPGESTPPENADVAPVVGPKRLFTFKNRIQLGLMGTSYTGTDFFTKVKSDSFCVGPMAAAAVEFNSHFGANLYMGLPLVGHNSPWMILGLEGEYMPIAAGQEFEPVEWALLGGVNYVMGGLFSGSFTNLYGGGRIGMNMTKRYGFDFTLRTNLSYYNASAGIYVRF